MTCIVAVRKESSVLIGTDRLSSNGWTGDIGGRAKVFRNGDYLMAACGSIRFAHILQWGFEAPPCDSWDVWRFMSTTFDKALRKALSDAGWNRKDDGNDTGANFFVAYKTHLFEFHSDHCFVVIEDPYIATGSGGAFASGAMHAAFSAGKSPEEAAKIGLEAACKHCITCRGPFDFMETT
jgi:ATP-dependent protease HslVU (ClpYQ) peptidase subunit